MKIGEKILWCGIREWENFQKKVFPLHLDIEHLELLQVPWDTLPKIHEV